MSNPVLQRQKNAERMRRWRRDNLEEARRRDREYCRKNPERKRLNAAKAKYGLTHLEISYRRSLPCEICGERMPEGRTGLGQNIDHCHDTGELRGTLCNLCNRGLGQFKDDPQILINAARYLIAWTTRLTNKAAA